MASTLIFIYGLLLGSFYNVVGLRIPKKQSISFPGSHCPSCQKELSWYELIPVFSWIFLKGKCKNCKSTVSALYLIMELLTGLLFVYAYLLFGISAEGLFAILLVSLVIIITISDLAYMIIPDKVLIFFGILFTILRFIFPSSPWWDPIAGAVVGFGIMLLLAVISKGGMGGGDIKLFFVVGLVLGLKGVILTIFISSLAGSAYGLILIFMRKFNKRQPIPFGPFIGMGALVTYFHGNAILNWYFSALFY